MDLEAYTQALDKLEGLHARGDYEATYTSLSELVAAWPGAAALLIRRGRVGQLRDEGSLEAIRDDLETAAALDPDSAAARLELGHFEYAVEDDPAAGLAAFEEAARLAGEQHLEALIGQARCLVELGRLADARRVLTEAVAISADPSDLAELNLNIEED